MSQEPGRTRVLIVDDHAVVRAGLRYVFESLSSIEVCAEAATAGEALEAVRTHRPDLVMLDLALGDASGRALIEPLRQLPHPPRILVMSMHDECVWGRLVLAAGADGFVAKSAPPETVISAVSAVIDGHRWVEGHAVPRSGPGAERTATAADLSARERQILEGIAAGLSAKDIAARLGVMPATIDSHKRNIRSKLGIDSMAELIVWAQSLHSPDLAP
jgi:DNA-binding NarL/FixJ family response regulator